MLIGFFVEYKGYKGTIEYDYEDNIHYGSLLDIEDSISYHAKNGAELYDHYTAAIDDYIKFKRGR